jgi:hypothetical protein
LRAPRNARRSQHLDPVGLAASRCARSWRARQGSNLGPPL